MAKMTLKQMNEQAKELNMAGYETAEAIFRHGLQSLMSSQESLKADRENPIKYQMDRIINDLHDIGIAENILREWYGIMFCDIGTHRSQNGYGAQVYCGIEELAKAVGKTTKETNEWQLRKDFTYDWCNIGQLAERNSTEYRKAFDANPKNFSTTYERVYGGKDNK